MTCGICLRLLPPPPPLREDHDTFTSWDADYRAWRREMKRLTGLCRCFRCHRCQGLAKGALGLATRQDCRCPVGPLVLTVPEQA